MASLPNPVPSNDELIEVFASQQDSEVQVVQSLLESESIDSLVIAEVGPQDILPVGTVVIKVAPDDAERARQLISDSQKVTDQELADEEDTQELDAASQ